LLAVVVWNGDVTLRSRSTQLQPAKPDTTTCGVKYSLVILTMGIIMPETC